MRGIQEAAGGPLGILNLGRDRLSRQPTMRRTEGCAGVLTAVCSALGGATQALPLCPMGWVAAVAYDCLGTGNGDVGSGFHKGAGVISGLGSVPGHTDERAAGGPAHLDRRSCWIRIGSSLPADDFRKLCEFSCGFMGELRWITGAFELFRTKFCHPKGCAVSFRAC